MIPLLVQHICSNSSGEDQQGNSAEECEKGQIFEIQSLLTGKTCRDVLLVTSCFTSKFQKEKAWSRLDIKSMFK